MPKLGLANKHKYFDNQLLIVYDWPKVKVTYK
ncbi:MAG: hypothetical protein HW405_811 [Candidatus Berkelbacteria bacterium]|nr:hypothetical protein [Candidatus Berkelbacteria bacterium]